MTSAFQGIRVLATDLMPDIETVLNIDTCNISRAVRLKELKVRHFVIRETRIILSYAPQNPNKIS